MGPYWVRVGPNAVTGVLIRREGFRHKVSAWGERHVGQRLEGCIHKPRNTRDFWELPEAEREKSGTESFSEPSGGTSPADNLDSRTERLYFCC